MAKRPYCTGCGCRLNGEYTVNKMVCSVVCHHKLKAYKKIARQKAVRPGNCKTCGTEIMVRDWGKNRTKYCVDCRDQLKSEYTKKQMQNLPDILVKCINCNKEIAAKLCTKKRCTKCYNAYHSKRGCLYYNKKTQRPAYIECIKCGDKIFGAKRDRKYCDNGCRPQRKHLPVRIIRAVYERDKNCCVFCDQNGPLESNPLTIEHLIPKSKGGADTMDNLVVACRFCNLSKGKKDLVVFLGLV